MEDAVDFVLIAGDIYDAGLNSYDTALYFHRQLNRLKEAGIKAFLIYGNHDALSKLDTTVKLPQNVHVFPAAQAETWQDAEEFGVAIHGQSYSTAAVTGNIATNYPAPTADLFNIGLLHTSLTGVSGHASYAPCTQADLVNKGYDYWALGHVHNRNVIGENPRIVFPGNTQARQRREAGEKTCELISFDDSGVTKAETRVTDALPWYELEVPLTAVENRTAVMEAVERELRAADQKAGDRTLIAGLTLTGATKAHSGLADDRAKLRAEVQAIAEEVAPDKIWLADIAVKTAPLLDLGALAQCQDPLGEVLRTAQDLITGDAAVDFAHLLAKLIGKIPQDLLYGEDALRLDKDGLEALLPDVKSLLATSLSEGSEP